MNTILQKKTILQHSPLFDDEYFNNSIVPESEKSSVAAEVRYINETQLWKCGISGLFNGSYYAYGSEDLANLTYPPVFHYITNGYFEARRPSALVDIDYIVSQILDIELPDDAISRHELKKEVLNQHSGILCTKKFLCYITTGRAVLIMLLSLL